MTPPEPDTTDLPLTGASMPPPIKTDNLWDLEADPGAVQSVAAAWRKLAEAARDQAGTVDRRAQHLHNGEWRGDTADTFHDHRLKVTRDMYETATAADQAADALDAVASNLTYAQAKLDDSWARISCSSTKVDDMLQFLPWKPGDVKTVNDEIETATDIRSQLNDHFYDNSAALNKARSQFDILARTWRPNSTNTSSPFTMPPDAKGGSAAIIDYENNVFIINVGNRDDEPVGDGESIEIMDDPSGLDVAINARFGEQFRVPEGMKLIEVISAMAPP